MTTKKRASAPAGKRAAKAKTAPGRPKAARPRPAPRTAGAQTPPPPSPRQLAHLEAVAVYERGVQALQRHDYTQAAAILQSVLERHPEEKELHDRVRLYLNVCQRATLPEDPTPQSTNERVYAATLAINAGAYRDALAHLQAVIRERPHHDHAHYMLAIVLAAMRNIPEALAELQKAIDLNPDNRSSAWQDADLDVLRDQPRFRTLVGASRRSTP